MEVKLKVDVKQITKEIVNELYKIMKQEGFFEKKTLTIYQKTERLLDNLSMIKVAIENKKNILRNIQIELDDIRKEIDDKKVLDTKRLIKLEAKDKLQNEIKQLEEIVKITEKGLESISNHKYFKIIDMKYNRNKTLETIAEELHISIATVKRSRQEMIKQLGIIIFSDEIIKEIMR